jgi:cyclohexyl-isocyanide hydratase
MPDRNEMTMAISHEPSTLSVGMILFPNFTQLDLTGPYEVFARLPGARVYLIGDGLAPVRTEHGLTISVDNTFDGAPALDIICVPGGPGVDAMMENEKLLAFLQSRASSAQYVTSVCTGALVLGAAGLLRGYRATTHWLSRDILELFGAEVVDERVVIDRDRVTGGGVTAGVDFGLTIAARLFGATVAQSIQLMLEYCPAPPFNSGSVTTAPTAVVQDIVTGRAGLLSKRREIAERAAVRLALTQ